MAAEYTVLAAKNAGEKNNPHGGKLTKWYLTLRNEGGIEKSDVYSQTKPGNIFTEGDKVYGRVESGQYGPRFFREQRPDGSAPASNGSGGGSPSGRDENGTSIEAQVALKVAGEIVAAGKADVTDLTKLTVRAFNAIQVAKQGDGAPAPHAMAETSDVPADLSDFEGDGKTAPPPDDDIPF